MIALAHAVVPLVPFSSLLIGASLSLDPRAGDAERLPFLRSVSRIHPLPFEVACSPPAHMTYAEALSASMAAEATQSSEPYSHCALHLLCYRSRAVGQTQVRRYDGGLDPRLTALL